MCQLENVLLAIDKAHTVPQRALDYCHSIDGTPYISLVVLDILICTVKPVIKGHCDESQLV